MYDLDKIAEIPIRKVAEELGVNLKKRGKDYVANCLWHEDKHPSMVVGGKYNRCHCFSCGADYGVLDLVMKVRNVEFKEACEWLGAPKPPQSQRPPQSPCLGGRRVDYFNVGYLEERMTMKNSFVRCMMEVFGEERTAEVVRMYKLGSWEAYGRHPDVMFPLINKEGKILDIKIQGYDCYPTSERFFHSIRNVCYWLGATLKKEGEFNHEALFGEHLLRQFPSKTVVLTESPKNACVCAAAYPQYLCLATGNKNMLKRDVLEVLRGRKVVVFPDNDAFEEWNGKLQQMQDIALFHCVRVRGDVGEKGDVADWILSPPSPLLRAKG